MQGGDGCELLATTWENKDQVCCWTVLSVCLNRKKNYRGLFSLSLTEKEKSPVALYKLIISLQVYLGGGILGMVWS